MIEWSAAALVAAALFALPVLVLSALEDSGAVWFAALAADLCILVVHAWRTSSPLIVLAAALVVAVAAVAFYVVVLLGQACGEGTAAAFAEWTGAAVIGLGLGAWGVLNGLRILWVTPFALVCAGGWIVLAANLVPGGAGSCFN